MGAIATVVDPRRGTVVCERCEVADTPLRRLRGLLGRSSLPAGEGLLLRPTPAVHTSFMRFPLDLVFLDGDLVVVDVVDELQPWRAAARRAARAVLELAAGERVRRHVVPGDQLALVSPPSPWS
ncbi:MAG: DUF192 domain-containing protein [Actinomycetota bacterium]|nr:DUF192 domain-containing protein [Actinomycetota bacterium]